MKANLHPIHATHPGGGEERSSPCLSASSVAGGESPRVARNSAMQFEGRTMKTLEKSLVLGLSRGPCDGSETS